MNFFRKIAITLLNEGHRVRCLSLCDVPEKKTADPWEYSESDWAAFDWKNITQFSPDRVIIFNGMFRELYAASQFLKKIYPTSFAEVAWFPQNDYIYIDREIHHRGQIANFNMEESGEITENHRKIIQELKNKYLQKTTITEQIDILIPMQLEYDTSILYASDLFKSMKSLVGFVKNFSGNARIVVKTHPKNNNNEPRYKYMHTADNVGLVKKLSTMGVEVLENQSIYNLTLASKLIVGINSTSLMEALIHCKPILQLGNNVAHHSGTGCMLDDVYYLSQNTPIESALKDVEAGTAKGYNPELMQKTLLHMYANQIDFRNPPRWAIDRILDYNVPCRTIKDLR